MKYILHQVILCYIIIVALSISNADAKTPKEMATLNGLTVNGPTESRNEKGLIIQPEAVNSVENQIYNNSARTEIPNISKSRAKATPLPFMSSTPTSHAPSVRDGDFRGKDKF